MPLQFSIAKDSSSFFTLCLLCLQHILSAESFFGKNISAWPFSNSSLMLYVRGINSYS